MSIQKPTGRLRQSTLEGKLQMPKALCLTAMVISILVFLLFFSDLALGFMGLSNIAPFRFANATIDIVFSICAAILGFLAFTTFREQI